MVSPVLVVMTVLSYTEVSVCLNVPSNTSHHMVPAMNVIQAVNHALDQLIQTVLAVQMAQS